MATGTNAWSLSVLLNNLEARVNALGGGGGGGVTNPLSANLAAAGFDVTGVGQLTGNTLIVNSQGGALSLQSAATTKISVDATGVTFGPGAAAPVRIWTGAAAGTQVVASSGTVPTGPGNTIFGQAAATGAGACGYSTAVGNGAAYSLTTGSRNTAVGYNAGSAITGAAENTFVGAEAGQTATGASNVGLGYSAGQNTTNGVGNISIGAGALGAAGTLDSIVIGRAAVNAASNEIVIGATAIGAGTNTIQLGNSSATTLYAPPLAILGGAGRLLGNTLAVDSSTTPLELQTGGVTRASVTTTGLIGVRPPQRAAYPVGGLYTPPVGVRYLEIVCIGGGGGGNGSANGAGGTQGAAGGTSSVTDNSGPFLVASASGGAASGYYGDGGYGGAGTTGDLQLGGQIGDGGAYTGPYAVPRRGGAAPGCYGFGGLNTVTSAVAATGAGGFGSGGGGGWVLGLSAYSGGGGGGGGYAGALYTIATPAAPPTFTIVIGAGGAAGANGGAVNPASQPSAGGAGLVIIVAHF